MSCHWTTPQWVRSKDSPAVTPRERPSSPAESGEMARSTGRRRLRPAILQVFLHLRAGDARSLGGPRPLLAVALSALTAVLGTCALLLGAPAGTAPATAATGPCPGANLRPTATNGAALQGATLCLINRIRAAHHLRALHANRELRSVATSQVATMVHWNYFADVRPTGQTPLSLVSVSRYPAHAASVSVGQNIAWATGGDTSPTQIVAAWMASPPHRQIILTGEFRDAGVAAMPAVPSVIHAGTQGATYAVEFAHRLF